MQLFLPAAYRTAVGPEGGRMGGVSVAIALVLLVTYTLNLLFVLVTHLAVMIARLVSLYASGEGKGHHREA